MQSSVRSSSEKRFLLRKVSKIDIDNNRLSYLKVIGFVFSGIFRVSTLFRLRSRVFHDSESFNKFSIEEV